MKDWDKKQDRFERAIRGATYAAIARELGVSKTRVQQDSVYMIRVMIHYFQRLGNIPEWAVGGMDAWREHSEEALAAVRAWRASKGEAR